MNSVLFKSAFNSLRLSLALKMGLLSCTVLLIFALSSFEVRASTEAKRVEQFIEIALGQEYRAGRSVLRRWERPIRVRLHQRIDVSPQIIALVDEHLHLLKQATKHAITQVDENSNVDLYLVSQAQLNKTWQQLAKGEVPRDALCAAQISTTARGEIIKGIILIPVDRASQRGRLLSCLVEELTQVTGLVNDSVDVYPSIFNDRSTDQMITPLDWLFLSALYDSQLAIGMSEADVRAVLPDIFKRLIDNHELIRASQLINQSALFQLLSVD